MQSIIKKLLFTCLLFCGNMIKAQRNCECFSIKNISSKGVADSSLLDKAIFEYNNNNVAICKAKYSEIIANIFLQKKMFDSAIIWLNQSSIFYATSNCNNQFELYNSFGLAYENKSEYQTALQHYLQALSICEQQQQPLAKANILLSISQIFNRLKQANKGISYTRKVLPLINELNLSSDKAAVLNKVGARYFFYYQDFKDTTYRDSAKFYVNNALLLSQKIRDAKNEIIALTRLNAIAESQQQFDIALQYIQQAMALCERGKDNRQLGTLYGDKGHLLMQLNKLDEARLFADSCLYANKLEKHAPLIANAYSLIYEIAKKTGNYKDALWAMENEKKITDSLLNNKNVATINELEKKYVQTQNESTIKTLSQQKKIYVLVGLLILIGTLFFVRHQHLKHKQKVLETEQRLNRARINPHFFFNTLTTLQSFAIRDNNGKAISDNLAKFSHIMRETLESTYKDYITIEQEIVFLEEYLQLQEIRFPRRFDYEIIVQETMEVDEINIPAMIIQPFVENAIEHGLNNINYLGKIAIDFAVKNNEVVITIIDNGNGFSLANKLQGKHTSRASQIIQDRIYLLNIKLKTNARFFIDNVKNGSGVQVNIYLPLLYKTNYR